MVSGVRLDALSGAQLGVSEASALLAAATNCSAMAFPRSPTGTSSETESVAERSSSIRVLSAA